MFGAPVTGKVEYGPLAKGTVIQIASVDKKLVVFGFRFHDNLAIAIATSC